MTSGRLRRLWRRVRINMFGWSHRDYADPDQDSPERAAEKREDPARSRPGYPGDSMPLGPFTQGH
jgi:hypothetical protein